MFIKSAKHQFSCFPLIAAPFSPTVRQRAFPPASPWLVCGTSRLRGEALTGSQHRSPWAPTAALAAANDIRATRQLVGEPRFWGHHRTVLILHSPSMSAESPPCQKVHKICHLIRFIINISLSKSYNLEAISPHWSLNAFFFLFFQRYFNLLPKGSVSPISPYLHAYFYIPI